MSYQMLMPLLDPSESYVNGFEAGMLWKIMESGQPVKQYLVHTVNMKQIELMAKRFHYTLIVNSTEEEWTIITAHLCQTAAN